MTRVIKSRTQMLITWLKRQKLSSLVVMLLAVVLLTTQTERLVSKGTLFGYEVRKVRPSNIRSATQNELTKGGTEASKICQALTEKDVEKVVNQTVTSSGGFSESLSSTKASVSSCIYQTKDSATKRRIITVTARNHASADSAKQALDTSLKRSGEAVPGVADQAVYTASIGRLTYRKDTEQTTITVNKGEKTQPDSKKVALEIAKILIAKL